MQINNKCFILTEKPISKFNIRNAGIIRWSVHKSTIKNANHYYKLSSICVCTWRDCYNCRCKLHMQLQIQIKIYRCTCWWSCSCIYKCNYSHFNLKFRCTSTAADSTYSILIQTSTVLNKSMASNDTRFEHWTLKLQYLSPWQATCPFPPMQTIVASCTRSPAFWVHVLESTTGTLACWRKLGDFSDPQMLILSVPHPAEEKNKTSHFLQSILTNYNCMCSVHTHSINRHQRLNYLRNSCYCLQ